MAEINGGELFQSVLERIGSKLDSADIVEVGFMEDAVYPDGTNIAFVAAMNEFGGENRPPRPFFRGMIQENSPQWPHEIGAQLIANEWDAKITLEHIGESIAGKLREAIEKYNGPPLKAATIKRKGSHKQLVDTGDMLKNISSVVTLVEQ